MSSLASTQIGGEVRSSWEYRSQYLLHGIVYTEFYCSFCDIRLAAGAIYIEDGESKVSPYFSARWEPHQNGCNGEAIIEGTSLHKTDSSRHRLTRNGLVPEMLSDRPKVRERITNLPVSVKLRPTSQETEERRKRAGSSGASIPKTYLLHPIIEARNIILAEVYESAKKENWSFERRKIAIEKALSMYPLQLKDKTNYFDAFKPPSFVHYTLPRIYYAKCKVTLIDGKYILENKFIRQKTGVMCEFTVEIPAISIEQTPPRSHYALLELLKQFHESQQEVNWFAYGIPSVHENHSLLKIHNLDYLYVKKAFTRN